MSELTRRDTQTKVKHLILEKYLHMWGAIITMGLKRIYEKRASVGASFSIKLVYVDCFSFQGRYADEKDVNGPVYGSPVIGIHALDEVRQTAREKAGFLPDVASILIEKEQTEYDILVETLNRAGYGSRIRKTTDFSTLTNGEIAVVHGNFHDYADKLRDFTTHGYTWSFYLLDPYGPSGIPLDIVASIITRQRTDVMINFPYQDLLKKTGSVIKETPEHKGHLLHFDRMYGNADWRNIAKEIDDSDHREDALVDRYTSTLQSLDQDLAVKFVPVKFSDKERTMFYLVLTTHDPTGAMTINEILDDAKLQEYDFRIERKTERELENNYATQPPLLNFGEIEDTNKPRRISPTAEEIAAHIYKLCCKCSLKYREVLRRLINTRYYHSEIKKAMSFLKKQKQVEYEDLLNDSDVIFR